VKLTHNLQNPPTSRPRRRARKRGETYAGGDSTASRPAVNQPAIKAGRRRTKWSTETRATSLQAVATEWTRGGRTKDGVGDDEEGVDEGVRESVKRWCPFD